MLSLPPRGCVVGLDAVAARCFSAPAVRTLSTLNILDVAARKRLACCGSNHVGSHGTGNGA